MAGSWRNWSFSLVGFERFTGMGKPAVAERRGTHAGQRLEGGQSPGGASLGALGVPGGEGAGTSAAGGKASVIWWSCAISKGCSLGLVCRGLS